jgi:hypothetical protein
MLVQFNFDIPISCVLLSFSLALFSSVEKKTNREAFSDIPNLDGRNCFCRAGASDFFM